MAPHLSPVDLGGGADVEGAGAGGAGPVVAGGEQHGVLGHVDRAVRQPRVLPRQQAELGARLEAGRGWAGQGGVQGARDAAGAGGQAREAPRGGGAGSCGAGCCCGCAGDLGEVDRHTVTVFCGEKDLARAAAGGGGARGGGSTCGGASGAGCANGASRRRCGGFSSGC